MKKFLRNNSGVTMMEVLITVAVLAIVVVPCLSSFVVAQRGNVLARQTADTYTQASNLIEMLKGVELTDAEKSEGKKTWQEAVIEAMQAYDQAADAVTAFAEPHAIPGSTDGSVYLIVYVYEGALDQKPEGDTYLLKGVITQ